ncbi:BREX-2 system adenine-specific DNA-methyltransferase PglX [Streptomyces sp. NPDC058217]|uniref:BREX-2 system adenine-specific DNA-methyltransferase PglX n=1 Tax=Streptomyces sp. NPDC058217 TaxID=3346384 RepID=UPI0036E7CC19
MNQTELLKDLRKQVKALEDDLRARSEAVAEYKAKLEAEYAQARVAKRTAATYGAWRDERITQVAAAWVLACVFVRFCEDNRLITDPFLAGPGERLKDAEDRDAEYFRLNPEKNDRDWLVHAFESLAATNPTVAGLFDRAHNPLWELAPSYEAASTLLKFWRRRGPDGEIVHDFTDEPVVGEDGVIEHEGLSTRFLGDLYQDLSEHARKTYALLQTPEFVEEFILDLTLEPAVKEFGLQPEVAISESSGEIRRLSPGLRTIDPTCGSGHFILGLFHRLLKKWRQAEPGTDAWTLIRRASESVHGCDKNPFAVSIARFRLLIAAMKAGEAERLDDTPTFPINIAVGDSLLHGRGASGIQEHWDVRRNDDGSEELVASNTHTFSTEDIGDYSERCDLLGKSSYHVVVGNPPYIEVKGNKFEKENYKKAYSSCHDAWTLSVPFAQRFFELGVRGLERGAVSGFAGQITSDAFMRRNFGKKLIEEFFPTISLTHIIDSSKASIPGHNREGTPTVILAGRNCMPEGSRRVRVVRSIQAETSQPVDPAVGLVWRSIIDQISHPAIESPWTATEDLDIASFRSHPWSLAGGGMESLCADLERGRRTVRDVAFRLGFYGDSHADEAFTLPVSGPLSHLAKILHARPSHRGGQIRDWRLQTADLSILPYSHEKKILPYSALGDVFVRYFWPLRTRLWMRNTFGGQSYRDKGREWWSWHQLPKDSGAHPWTIAHAFKVSHNHFVLDCNDRVFTRTGPIVKLPASASEEDHYALLGVLNSSIAGFWLRAYAQHQGGGAAAHSWSWTHEFASSIVGRMPIPSSMSEECSRAIVDRVRALDDLEPDALCRRSIPSRTCLDSSRDAYEKIRTEMVSLQEELDWRTYSSYGLLSSDEQKELIAPNLESVPGIYPGERAFEIALARRLASGELNSAWFSRQSHSPITEIPSIWPQWYRDIVQARIRIIERRQDIGWIERPDFKRRWFSSSWEKREEAALRTWLLDRVGDRSLWFALRDGFDQPRPLTISQLADELSQANPGVSAVAALYAADHIGKRDLPLEEVLARVLDGESVPYLAALRYKDTGLRTRSQWEEVWELQREEDMTGNPASIASPPLYTAKDFRESSFWANRGDFDIPKERFVSYPEANPDADPTLLLGWAGWDHRDQAQVLVNLVKDRTSQLSWDNDRIAPLLAGLAELMPWVRQWFGTDDQEWGGNAAEEFGTFLDTERTKRGRTAEQLAAWRPAPKTRGRKTTASRAPKKTDTSAADTQTA